ncbi:hypothetical protein [Micromonospora sp. KC213]|uniref:hypothetical protein n=1 Tax=Micromonospora sp. KC213 TaxID=2530378 RepID=UPI0010433905|nr:hypothetical protein [Micromonospora sp. KC213]TDC41660.1 hypothetical protein E1166_10685 [Micromonospora sp. KC213]
MAGPELVFDEGDWHYRTSGDRWSRSGRLRVWRDADSRLVAMVTIRDHVLRDDGCLLPEQVRARFPSEDVEVVAYEPSWWGTYEQYYLAVADDRRYRWEEINGSILAERLSPIFVVDDEGDDSPGGDSGI